MEIRMELPCEVDTGTCRKLPLCHTVFAIFDNNDLKAELEKWAENNACRIYWGDPNSPDIYAIPYFVSIIDRRILSEVYYTNYVRWCNADYEGLVGAIVKVNEHGEEEILWEDGSVDNLSSFSEDNSEDEVFEWVQDVCIFVDDLYSTALPKLPVTYHVNLDEVESVGLVISLVEISRKSYLLQRDKA